MSKSVHGNSEIFSSWRQGYGFLEGKTEANGRTAGAPQKGKRGKGGGGRRTPACTVGLCQLAKPISQWPMESYWIQANNWLKPIIYWLIGSTVCFINIFQSVFSLFVGPENRQKKDLIIR